MKNYLTTVSFLFFVCGFTSTFANTTVPNEKDFEAIFQAKDAFQLFGYDTTACYGKDSRTKAPVLIFGGLSSWNAPFQLILVGDPSNVHRNVPHYTANGSLFYKTKSDRSNEVGGENGIYEFNGMKLSLQFERKKTTLVPGQPRLQQFPAQLAFSSESRILVQCYYKNSGLE